MLLPDQLIQTPRPHPHRQRSRTVVDISQAPTPTTGNRTTRQLKQPITHPTTLTAPTDTHLERVPRNPPYPASMNTARPTGVGEPEPYAVPARTPPTAHPRHRGIRYTRPPHLGGPPPRWWVVTLYSEVTTHNLGGPPPKC